MLSTPNPAGGTFVTWDLAQSGPVERRLSKIASNGAITEQLIDGTTFIQLAGDEDVAYVLVNGIQKAIDIATWSPLFDFVGRPNKPLHNKGVIAHDGSILRTYRGDGTLQSSVALAADTTSSVVKQREWISVNQDSSFQGQPVRAVAGPVEVEVRRSFGQIFTSRTVGVSCIPPPFIDADVEPNKRNKGMASNRDYTIMFRREEGIPLWPSVDHDNDIIPNVLLGFELWELANLELNASPAPRLTTFTKISSGAADLTLIQDANIDLEFDLETGQLIYGKSDYQFDQATGIFIPGGTITWDNADVTELLFFKKVTLHEVGHLMGLGHGVDRVLLSVMNNASGYQDERGRISEVVTVCDRDKAAEAATRPWPIP